MASKNIAAFGIFPTRESAEVCVDRLTASGFSDQDVSVLMSDIDSSRDFATEKNTKAPEGTAAGVGIGGIVGGDARASRGHRRACDSGRRPAHRRGSHHGRARRSRRRRRGWRTGRRAGRHGHSRVRGQALRRPHQKWRHPHLRALRHLRRGHPAPNTSWKMRAARISHRPAKRASARTIAQTIWSAPATRSRTD